MDIAYAAAGPEFIRNLELLAALGTLISFSIFGGMMPEVGVFGELRGRLGKNLGVRCYSTHGLDTQPVLRRALMQREST